MKQQLKVFSFHSLDLCVCVCVCVYDRKRILYWYSINIFWRLHYKNIGKLIFKRNLLYRQKTLKLGKHPLQYILLSLLVTYQEGEPVTLYCVVTEEWVLLTREGAVPITDPYTTLHILVHHWSHTRTQPTFSVLWAKFNAITGSLKTGTISSHPKPGV